MTTLIEETSKRLPRYKRNEEVRLAITSRDLEILKVVEDFRLLTSAHIQGLSSGSDQQILRRLQKLFHAGLLDRVTPRVIREGGGVRMIYAITNKGRSLLQKEGLIKEIPATDINGQNRSLHDMSVEHTLLISHIRTLFTLAGHGTSEAKLMFWREGRALFDSIEVTTKEGHVRLPVAPDAFLGIQTPKGRTYFFLEADRGTMTVKRFTRKLVAFSAWYKDRKHEGKFAIKHFRVLTVTLSPVRQKNLMEAALAEEKAQPGRPGMFLFANEKELPLKDPESVFHKIWMIPGMAGRHAILGN